MGPQAGGAGRDSGRVLADSRGEDQTVETLQHGGEEQRRREEKGEKPQVAPGEDPDIAGIVPGPQPVLEEAP